MKFSKKEVLHLADLTKLKLSEEEIKTYQKQLKDVLNYVDKINELDLDTIKESLSGVEDLDVAPPRLDIVEDSSPETVNHACNVKDNYIISPKVFNNED